MGWDDTVMPENTRERSVAVQVQAFFFGLKRLGLSESVRERGIQ
jgi:hypothetical protein